MGLSVSLGKLIPRAKLLLGGVSFYSVYNTVTCELIDLYYVGDGGSMEPTLSVGDIVWVRPVGTGHYLSDLLYYFGLPTALTYQDIRVGDVVVSNHPVLAQKRIIKRVIGLQGSQVAENYRQQDRLVPVGRVWLEGDRSSDSLDSRHYGAVPLGLLTARVEGKICPARILFSTLPSYPVSTPTS